MRQRSSEREATKQGSVRALYVTAQHRIQGGKKEGRETTKTELQPQSAPSHAVRSALCEFYGPEARGGAEEFEADQGFTALSFYYAGDPAEELFVGLHVGH